MAWDWWKRSGRVTAEKARRITGVSTPLGGVSWSQAEKSEREIVREFVVFLEDRRALYNPTWMEMRSEVVSSILQIRHSSTEYIQRLDEGGFAESQLRAIRAACRRFLDGCAREDSPVGYSERFWDDEASFFVALGELRASVGASVAQLLGKYDLDIEGDLATIIPPEDET